LVQIAAENDQCRGTDIGIGRFFGIGCRPLISVKVLGGHPLV
jgi:hypothetical protein